MGILIAALAGLAFMGFLLWIVLRIAFNGIPLNVTDEEWR